MAPAKYETTSVKIGADQYIFTVSASKIIFDGFMSVYTDEEDQKKGNVLNQSLERGMKLSLKELKTRTAFHAAACTLYRGISGQDHGRTGDRTPKYLCADDHNDHQPPLCCKRTEEPVCYRVGGSCQ